MHADIECEAINQVRFHMEVFYTLYPSYLNRRSARLRHKLFFIPLDCIFDKITGRLATLEQSGHY